MTRPPRSPPARARSPSFSTACSARFPLSELTTGQASYPAVARYPGGARCRLANAQFSVAAVSASVAGAKRQPQGRTEMGKIVVSENVSLDGVAQDPTGEEGFRHGGWFGQIGDKDREAWAKMELDEALGAEALLLGRRRG